MDNFHIVQCFLWNRFHKEPSIWSVCFSSALKWECRSNRSLMSIAPLSCFVFFTNSVIHLLPVFLSLLLSSEPWGLSSPSPLRERSVFQARARSTLQLTEVRLNVWSCFFRKVIMSTPCWMHTSLVGLWINQKYITKMAFVFFVLWLSLEYKSQKQKKKKKHNKDLYQN